MNFRLLSQFEATFFSKKYRHRSSTIGDAIAAELFEDLVAVDRSEKLKESVSAGERVLNSGNRAEGVRARRGDGTFGELVPGESPSFLPGRNVARGPLANIEIGVEVKILAKAMIKQIDRVTGDLVRQAQLFRGKGNHPVTVGVVGVNHADKYVSYEGDRSWPTDGGKYKHPCQEAADAMARLQRDAAPEFDEFVVLPYEASNEAPYPFAWLNFEQVRKEYAALLLRVLRTYEQRF